MSVGRHVELLWLSHFGIFSNLVIGSGSIVLRSHLPISRALFISNMLFGQCFLSGFCRPMIDSVFASLKPDLTILRLGKLSFYSVSTLIAVVLALANPSL